MHRRIAIVVAAGAGAVATTAVIATSGSAQSPQPTTLHLVEKTQKTVGFDPGREPRQGDRFGFGSRLTGDDTGFDRGSCTLVGKQALCTIWVKLSKGTLAAQGIASFSPSKNTPFAITGGTGAYDGARGTALVTDVNSTTADIRITLRP